MYVYTYYWTMLMLMGDSVDPTTEHEALFVIAVGLVGALRIIPDSALVLA